jgi:glycosyltransferase involved in cell wall biosynthesis
MTAAAPTKNDFAARADSHSAESRIAVLVTCYNEAKTVYDVVKGFQAALPNAIVYVYDNNSIDEMVAEAERAGAAVRLYLGVAEKW